MEGDTRGGVGGRAGADPSGSSFDPARARASRPTFDETLGAQVQLDGGVTHRPQKIQAAFRASVFSYFKSRSPPAHLQTPDGFLVSFRGQSSTWARRRSNSGVTYTAANVVNPNTLFPSQPAALRIETAIRCGTMLDLAWLDLPSGYNLFGGWTFISPKRFKLE
ncbi:hypothetical protein B0H12DRAFT_1075900 [Mycena haematopus]|nr:hypothetical protein B0H12DRAFT_1075900 [Mycena haematopus]